MYTEKKFKTLIAAKTYKKKFKKMYGYNPRVFKVKKNGSYFVVVKPYGLQRVDTI